jgi:colicin import membrane protein
VRSGLATSVVLHAAILAWALFTIQAQRELRMPEPEPIAVDLVNASDLTRLRRGARDAKELEAQPKEAPKTEPAKKEAPRPAPVAAAPPPPAPPPPPPEEPKEEPKKELASAPPPPAPEPIAPAPEEQKKLDELLKAQERQAEEQRKLDEQKKLEEQQKLEEQKRLEEERKQAELKHRLEEEKKRKEAELKRKREEEKKRKEAEAKKKQFDAEKIAALLNKVPDKGAPRPSVPLEEQAKSLLKAPVLGAPEGRDRQVSASELAILAQRIRQCVQSKWNLLAGGEQAQHTLVKLRLRFNPDGTLAGPPVIMNPQSTPYFLAVSDSAIRAAQACEPYSLPPEKYELWRDIVLNFDPRDMY